MSDEVQAAAAEAVRTAVAADHDAAVLQSAGQREADVLETAGVREAAVLATAGVRDAQVLQTAGMRDAAVLEAAGVRDAAILRVEGQRRINLIWENTQMRLAISVIWSALLVAGGLSVFGRWLGSADLQLAAVVFLFGVANLVTGFYFGRTNHQREGGVGVKDTGR